jgi:hypothetical protein
VLQSQSFRSRSRVFLFLLSLALLVSHAPLRAQTIVTVCAASCTYTNANLQNAINSAAAGTLILLQEGFEYVGDFSMPVKTGAGPTAKIEIRTGVNAAGVVQNVNRYPADNIRVCPSGYSSDWFSCATRSPYDMTRYAKIKPSSNNAYAIRTAATGSGTPVSYYKLRWLEFAANSFGGNSLIGILNDTAPMSTGSSAHLPHHFEFDQLVVRGHPVSGQFRGAQIDGNHVSFTNSFFYDIKALGEGQVFWVNSSTGPITVTNNYMSGGTEVFFTGGGGTRPEPQFTVQASPAPTATSMTFNHVNDLYVGKGIAFYQHSIAITSTTAASQTVVTTPTAHNLQPGYQIVTSGVTGCAGPSSDPSIGSRPRRVNSVLSSTTFTLNYNCTTAGSGGTLQVRAHAEVTSIGGNAVTVTPALPYTPVPGELVNSSLVVANMTIRHNVFTRPLSWRTTNIIAPPTGSVATPSTTGGTLSAGTYGYRVNARVLTAQGSQANSGAAAEVQATTTGTTGRVTITWNAVANATSYVVYGRTPGGQTTFWTVNAPATQYIDTGASGSGGSPVTTGSKWQVKNTFELKQARLTTIEHNVIEHSWQAGQAGPCVVFTGSQQNADGESAVLRDITFRYNDVRKCGQNFQLTGTDALGHESARSGNVNISQNVFRETGQPYGSTAAISIQGAGGGPRQHPNRAPFNITISHNTFHFTSAPPAQALWFDYCASFPTQTPSQESTSPNTLVKDNIFYNGTYGLVSTSPATANCNTGMSPGRIGQPPLGAGSSITTNVLAGGNCSLYTTTATNMLCTPIATLEENTFTNTTTLAGFAVKETSPYHNAGTDKTSIGANLDLILPGIASAESGVSGGSNQSPTAEAGGPYTGLSLDPIAFNGAASTDPDGTITTYRWTWGDGTPTEDTSSATANHAYSQPGPYTVTLVVIDNGGASSSGDTAQVTVGNRAPVANAGGPYTGAPLQVITLDAGASTDPDGSIASYQWHFGEEIVIRAADAVPADIHGRWSKVADGTAAGGWRLYNSNLGEATVTPALAVPTSYVDLRFFASQGVPYRLWLRLRAEGDDFLNDSVWVQFSGSVDAVGGPVYRIGTTAAAAVVLEEGSGGGLAGWGWNDQDYGGQGSPVYFNSDGWQTIRIQQRQDGPSFDQIVLSADTYSASAPGALKNDTTIVPLTLGTASGVSVGHGFRFAGAHYVRVTVTDNLGATNVAIGYANIAAGSPSPDADDLDSGVAAVDFFTGRAAPSMGQRWDVLSFAPAGPSAGPDDSPPGALPTGKHRVYPATKGRLSSTAGIR